MRYILWLLTVCFVIFGCTKSTGVIANGVAYNGVGAGLGTTWQLAQKSSSFAATALVTVKPAPDSSVLLILNDDSTYQSKLNGNLVCSGSYAITTDTSYYNAQILQLNNFTNTGIFSLFTLYEVGPDGQILSTYTGMTLHISNDSLTLTSPLTPGGYESYTFLKANTGR